MPRIVNWKKDCFTYFNKSTDKAFAPGNNLVDDATAERLKEDKDFIAAMNVGAVEFVEAKRAPSKIAPSNKAGKGEPVEAKISDDQMVAAIAQMFDPDALEAITLDEKSSEKVLSAAKTQLAVIMKPNENAD